MRHARDHIGPWQERLSERTESNFEDGVHYLLVNIGHTPRHQGRQGPHHIALSPGDRARKTAWKSGSWRIKAHVGDVFDCTSLATTGGN